MRLYRYLPFIENFKLKSEIMMFVLLFQGAKLDNQVLKSKTCDIVFVFFLEKSSFSALFVGVKEENWFS